jgi:uncharacterized protein YjbI with pentapeptide repeats
MRTKRLVAAASGALPPPKLQGKTFAFAHKLGNWYPVSTFPALIAAEGGTVVEKLTADVDFLIADLRPPSGAWALVRKAEELNQKRGAGIRVLDREAFFKLLALTREDALALLLGGEEGIRRWNFLRRPGQRGSLGGLRPIRLPSLAGADFRKARLAGAMLDKIKLDGGDFRGADLTGASLSESRSLRLDGACLVKAQLGDLTDCTFTKADLTGANFGELKGCDFTGSRMASARIWAGKLRACAFRKADLSRATFDGQHFGLVLSGCDFSGADLTAATLTECKFPGTTLAGARLERASFEECDLCGAVLSRANLAGADLSRVKFAGADLRGADLRGANCASADLRGARLDRARFDGANLLGAKLDAGAEKKAKGLERAQREGGKVGPHTRALQALAEKAKLLTTRAVVRVPRGYVRAEVHRHRAKASQTAGFNWDHVSGEEEVRWEIGEARSLGAAMLRLAERWAAGTLLPELIEVEVNPPPKGVGAWALAARAWHEVFGLDVASPEGLENLRGGRDAALQRLRAEFLADLRAGPDGVNRWNLRCSVGGLEKLCPSFAGADLSGACLEGARFYRVEFPSAVFDRAAVPRSRSDGSRFGGASFRGADLSEGKWHSTALDGADFEGASLRECRLGACNLTGASFRGADLTGATLNHCDLHGADFSTANLDGVTFERCWFDERTRFPPSFTSRVGLIWKGQGQPPAPAARPGSLDFAGLMTRLGGYVEAPRLAKALKMLKEDRFQLYSQAAADHLVGVVKSQTDPKLVYACRLGADGAYSCCTQNLNPCGGLRGALCKHLLVLVVGLAKAGQLDAALVDGWVQLTTARGAADVDRDAMSDVFLRYKGAEAGQLDWRPTETVPEDFYAL